MKPTLIGILGPTASGKSSLGIELAQQLNGEIISCDSRQVFRGLDIGTGKVTKKEQALVPHHLIDICNPEEPYSVSHYQKDAYRVIDDIVSHKKQPIQVGGTFLYAYSVIDNYQFTDVQPDSTRRKELEGKNLEELQNLLQEIYTNEPLLNEDDMLNPRRLIRAIEKAEAGASLEQQKKEPRYTNKIYAIDMPREILYERIDTRVDTRVQEGMIDEVRSLQKQGVSDAWLLNLGLEYRFITEYLQGNWNSEEEMLTKLKTAIHAFARRQLTWLRRDNRIQWITSINDIKV